MGCVGDHSGDGMGFVQDHVDTQRRHRCGGSVDAEKSSLSRTTSSSLSFLMSSKGEDTAGIDRSRDLE